AEDFKTVKKDILARLRNERETARATEFANALRARAQITVSDQPVTPPTNEAELARVYATVNGANITSRDIEQSLLPLIFRVQQLTAEAERKVFLAYADELRRGAAVQVYLTPPEPTNVRQLCCNQLD